MRGIFTYVFFLFFTLVGSAVGTTNFNYRFQQLGIEDGLPQSTVFCVFQDSKGFIWIGTFDGLSRYDGKDMKVFMPEQDNAYTINAGSIYDIEEGYDGRLYIATAGGGLNIFNPETETFSYWKTDSTNNSIVDNILYDVLQASDSSIWMASYGGVSQYFPNSGIMKSFTIQEEDNANYPDYSANCLFEDNEQNIWIGTFGDGLLKYDEKNKEFVAYSNTISSDDLFEGNIINQIVALSEDIVLLNTNNGIFKFSTLTNTFSNYKYPKCTANRILVDKEKNCWIASDKHGIYRVDSLGNHQNIVYLPQNRFSLPSNTLNLIFQDNNENIWVGVNNLGLAYCSTKQSPFFHFYKKDDPNSLVGNMIYGLAEDDDSNYWVATLSGLSIVSQKHRSYTNITHNSSANSISSNDIYDIINDGNGSMWLSTSAGVDQYDLTEKKFVHHIHNHEDTTSLPNTEYFCLGVDKNSEVWVGTYSGVIKYSNNNNSWVSHFNDNNGGAFDAIVWSIYTDKKGQLWFCTADGLYQYNYSTNSIEPYSKVGILTAVEVNCIQEDTEGNYWVGTQNGLIKFDHNNGEYHKITTEDGLPNNVIYGIVEHGDFVWLTSNKGLSRINKESFAISNFDVSDGLQSNEFNIASLKTKSGICLFGGINGITAFYPDNIKMEATVPELYFTALSLNGIPISPSDERNGKIPIQKSIVLADKIDISHQEKLIIVDFAAIEYIKSDKILYRYRILPDSKNWINLKKKNSVTLTMLPPGDYTLEIQSTDTEQNWANNSKSLRISITPPLYKRTWFVILQAIILGLAIVWYIKHRTNRIKVINRNLERTVQSRTKEINTQQRELKAQRDRILEQKVRIEKSAESLEIKVQNRTKELQIAKEAAEESERLKSAFLANMSHEIRTPMNAIVGFSDILATTEVSQDEKVNYLEIIQSNSDSLLNLLNDILDISIIESGKITLSIVEVSVHELMHSLFRSFEQNITFRSKPNVSIKLLPCKPPEIFMQADHFRLLQVLNNLVSNAIKYTQKGEIEIAAYKEKGAIVFRVKDTGIGIQPQNIDKIFDRFHKVDDGDTNPFRGGGLGLAISSNLVSLMKGKIWVDSEPGVGSVFFLSFPE